MNGKILNPLKHTRKSRKIQKHSRRTPEKLQKHSRRTPEELQMHSRYTRDTLQIHSRYTPDTPQKTSRSTPIQFQKISRNSSPEEIQCFPRKYNTTPEQLLQKQEELQKNSSTFQQIYCILIKYKISKLPSKTLWTLCKFL